jgi:tryptophanyl-tRNA synthetase
MAQRVLESALVNIACGLDPKRCTLFVQSHVPEHTELAWILNCVTPIGELERMTQFKEKSEQHRESVNLGLLDYPVLMAADIVLYKATAVPVGQDQAQHLELCREIVRKFNRAYGETFPEPETLFSPTLKVLGLDGKAKMSKTMNNFIGVLEPEKDVWEKLRTAYSDPKRLRRADPGDPAACNLFTIHRGFSTPETVARVDRECRSASIGCTDCKKLLFDRMMQELSPIRERAADLEKHPDEVRDVLETGAKRCKAIAEKTMEEVRRKAGLR